MTEKIKMTRDIHNFVRGEMDWEGAIDLLSRVSESDEWIDYLLMEMELYEYFNQTNRLVKDREMFISENWLADDGIVEFGGRS